MRITDAQLLEHIKQQKRKGRSDAQIQEALLELGYDEASIRETLDYLNSPAAATVQQIPNIQVNQSFPGPIPTGHFSRSWYLTKACWNIIMNDAEFFALTIFAAFSTLLFTLILLFPVWSIDSASDIVILIAILIFYFGISFIAAFFSMATAHVVKDKTLGGSPTMINGLGFAVDRLHNIFQWSMVNSTIGMIFRFLERLAHMLGPLGRFVSNFTSSMLGLTWTIVHLFTTPAMVIYDQGPFTAIKNSVAVLKRTWGENLYTNISFGLAKLSLTMLWSAFIIGGLVFGFILESTTIGILVLAFSGLFLVLMIYFFRTAEAIFNTNLFIYAANKTPSPYFSKETLDNALKSRKK